MISEFPAFLLIIIAGNYGNENMICSCIFLSEINKKEKETAYRQELH